MIKKLKTTVNLKPTYSVKNLMEKTGATKVVQKLR